jgi:hypothetical protein
MKSTDKISTYFKAYEVSRSYTADRLGIVNTPPPFWVMDNAIELAVHVLDPLRERWGPTSAQSWYRCEKLELELCWEDGFRMWCAKRNLAWITRRELYKNMGAQTSWERYFERKQHPKGQAVDVEYPGIDNDELYYWIRDNLAFDQLIREFPKVGVPSSGWVHVSWAGAQVNRQTHFSVPYYDKYA